MDVDYAITDSTPAESAVATLENTRTTDPVTLSIKLDRERVSPPVHLTPEQSSLPTDELVTAIVAKSHSTLTIPELAANSLSSSPSSRPPDRPDSTSESTAPPPHPTIPYSMPPDESPVSIPLHASILASAQTLLSRPPSVNMDGPPSPPLQNNQTSDRPLSVTDALSYLDNVKQQFQHQPEVYNNFLEIMKGFKSEKIDTPGVIQRVSQLFYGHPSLIQGFNTFLPVGYRIECSTDQNDSSVITVTTPAGTTTHASNSQGLLEWSAAPQQITHLARPVDTYANLSTIGPGQPGDLPDPAAMDVMEPAVAYVQKIKQTCDPDTYRRFLDIIAKHHRKTEPIDEDEVLKQINLLFKDSPELRSGFRVFIPDSSQHFLDDPPFPTDGRTRANTPLDTKRKLDDIAIIGAGSSGSVIGPGSRQNGNAYPPAKRKRKSSEKEKEKDMVPLRAGNNATKKLRHAASQDLTPASYSNQHASSSTGPRYQPGPSSPPLSSLRGQRPLASLQQTQQPPYSQILGSLMHHVPPPPSRQQLGTDEAHFFDRVKRALDNRDTYNEFLKVVNLFTQDYIDMAKLVKESRNFLGDTELLRQFKEILGWDDKKEKEHFLAEQQQQYGWSRPVIAGIPDRPSRADLTVKYGSYRKLPDSDVNVSCSGRDDMCRSVLNDEWVSHPTWSNEESGFIAHKKNIYEEALHRSEEERHEYDFHLDGIQRTIQDLEPILHKIIQLSPEERAAFKLKPGLGGQFKPIHGRIIKKIYGREAGMEVLSCMQDTPSAAIPVVIQRLKQKEEEWKRAQREWNKVWREVDARNYTKSLDHQGIMFKAVDKKSTTTKAFLSQVEAAREEQIAKRASLIDPLFARTRPRHQLEYGLEDVGVLQDVLKLTFSFLDRAQGQIGFAERRKIEGFLRSFVPLFFVLDPVTFNSAFVVVQEIGAMIEGDGNGGGSGEESNQLAEDNVTPGPSRGGGYRNRKGGVASGGGDLRKKLLKSEQAKSTIRKTRAQEAASSPAISRLASPALTDEGLNNDGSNQPRRGRKNVFFTNTMFYVLLRLIELAYCRLRLLKNITSQLVAEGSGFRGRNAISIHLGLPGVGPDSPNFGDRPANAEHFYDLLLESCERLFDNEVEQYAFEDLTRYMFGIKHAYKIFTIDKLIGAIIKQVQAIFTDPRSQELLENLKRDRAIQSPTTQDFINSRRNAEKILGPDENLFRIDWLPDSKTMTVQLLGKDDSSFDDSEVLTGRWQSYIDSFVTSENTDGVSLARVKRPFLRKNVPPTVRDKPPTVLSHDGIELKVCIRTYRLFYVPNTEDYLWKCINKDEMEEAQRNIKTRNGLRRKWLERASRSPLLPNS